MDGWTRWSITVDIEPVQDPWHLISEVLLKWQEVCQEPHSQFTFPSQPSTPAFFKNKE